MPSMSDPGDTDDTKDGTESDDVAPGEMTLGEELTTILDDLAGASDDEADDEADDGSEEGAGGDG
jgi:hypothetical protein